MLRTTRFSQVATASTVRYFSQAAQNTAKQRISWIQKSLIFGALGVGAKTEYDRWEKKFTKIAPLTNATLQRIQE